MLISTIRRPLHKKYSQSFQGLAFGISAMVKSIPVALKNSSIASVYVLAHLNNW